MASKNHRQMRRTSSLTHLLDATSLRTCDTPAACQLTAMLDTGIVNHRRSLDNPSYISDEASHFGKDFDLFPKMCSSVGDSTVSSLFDVCGKRPSVLASTPVVVGAKEVAFECVARCDHVPLGTEGKIPGYELHNSGTPRNFSTRSTDAAVATPNEPRQPSPWCYGADIATESWVPPSSAPQHDFGLNYLVTCDFCQISLDEYDIFMYGGQSAFCSQDCRQRQMLVDERNVYSNQASTRRFSMLPTFATGSTQPQRGVGRWLSRTAIAA